MQNTIAYNNAVIAGVGEAIAVDEGIQVTLVEITDYKFPPKSQFSVYLDASLGTLVSIDIRYFYADGAVDGFGNLIYKQVPIKDTSTGELIDRPSLLDSASPAQAGIIRVVEDLPVSAALAIKVTATGTGIGGSSGTVNSCRVLLRDN